MILFSSAVFRENPRYCYSFGVVVVVGMQKLTFCNISVITEDIYLNSEYVFTILRAIDTIKGDNSKYIFMPPASIDQGHLFFGQSVSLSVH